MVKDVTDCTIPELSPYIRGEVFTGEFKGARVNPKSVELFTKALSESITAKVTLDQCENSDDFYKIEVDFKHYIPSEDRANCFYAAKNGSYNMQTPPLCQYLVKKAWEMYKIPNLIPKLIPTQMLNIFFKKGYLSGGVTLHDVICNVACPEYNEFTPTRLRNNVGDYTEIYISSEDMVAIVPKSIASALDDNTLSRIKVTDYGLAVDNILLRTMCGYTGGINSTYDLRALI